MSENVRAPDDVETIIFDWGRFAVTCSPALHHGAGMSAGVTVLEPGSGHARHNHPGAEEILFVVSGSGEQMVEDAHETPHTVAVRPGSTVYVPADRFHATHNTGTEPLTIFVVYAPAGPERVARAMPDARIEPPARAGS